MEDDILASLLKPEQLKRAEGRALSSGLLNLGLGLLQGSQGQRGRPSTLSVLGQVGPQAVQAYQGSFDQTLRDIMLKQQMQDAKERRVREEAQASRPKFMTIKTPDGGERLIQIPVTGTPGPVDIAGLGGAASPKFDPATSAFLSYRYPNKSFPELNPDQQREIIEFSNAPDATKAADLERESKKTFFETGVNVPVPRGRFDLLNLLTPTTPAVTPAAPISAAPVISSPVAALDGTSMKRVSAVPVSQDMTPQTAQASALKLPANFLNKPLGTNEKPLVESAAITPKAKQELFLAQPKQTQAVEYVLETNSQMQSVIDELLSNKGFDDAFGFTGETISKIPGTNAARVRALLERLGGNLFIEAITAMRSASVTGSAVGNATEREGDKLQGSRAALMQAQKAEDARKELEALRETLRFQQGLVTNAYERTYGRGSFIQREPKKAPEQRKPLGSIFGGQ